MTDKTIVSEAVFEKMVDGRVMRRLYQDSAYRNAADAETQASRAQEIEDQCIADLEQIYEVQS